LETHVKVLAVLHLVTGACGVLFALALMLIFGGAAGIVGASIGASGDADAAIALPIIGITGVALVVFTLALALPGIIVGLGLWWLSPWARIAGIVLAILGLMWIPFGTILGIYGLWVLFSKETERLFAQRAEPLPAK
jgi:hypothetical protein